MPPPGRSWMRREPARGRASFRPPVSTLGRSRLAEPSDARSHAIVLRSALRRRCDPTCCRASSPRLRRPVPSGRPRRGSGTRAASASGCRRPRRAPGVEAGLEEARGQGVVSKLQPDHEADPVSSTCGRDPRRPSASRGHGDALRVGRRRIPAELGSPELDRALRNDVVNLRRRTKRRPRLRQVSEGDVAGEGRVVRRAARGVRVMVPDVEVDRGRAGRLQRRREAEHLPHERQRPPVVADRENLRCDVAERSGTSGYDAILGTRSVYAGSEGVHHPAIDVAETGLPSTNCGWKKGLRLGSTQASQYFT